MKKRYKRLLILAIAAISCGAYATVILKPVPVEVETAAQKDLTNSFTAQGIVEPEDSVILSSPSAGKVVEAPYKVGQKVERGAAIVKTDSGSLTDLDIQREQLSQQLMTARQEYARLYGADGADGAGGVDGAGGSHGAAALAEKAAQSEYELADKNYQNGRALAEAGGYISSMELTTLRTQRDLKYQKLLQARSDNSQAMREYHRSLIESCEKQLEMLSETVSPGTVKMPYDGVIWELYVGEGAYMAPNQQAAKVYPLGKMKIQASLMSEDALLLEIGQTAQVKYADGTMTDATVSFISQVAVQQMSSIGMEENRCVVELLAASLPENVGAGQQADITFTVTAAKNVFSVPSSAVVSGREGDMIYTVESGRATPFHVISGKKSGGRVEILKGIEEGAVVIVDPYEGGVKEGTRVEALLPQE